MEENYPCPVEGCDHGPFKTPQALQSHIRNIHPDFMEERGPAREVPIVEEEFATLLKKFRIKGDLAANIAENVSATGGPRVFEEPELLLKRLTLWSSDITPAKRKNIIEQWFAERGVDIPPEIQKQAGMTTEQIQKAEVGTKESLEVRYVYDPEHHEVRMAKKDEPGGTLSQAKDLKEMAEQDKKAGQESPFMQDGDGRWVLNPKARVTGVELMAVQFMQKSQERGEPVDPIMAMTQAAETWKTLREGLGVGASTLPQWMTDPAAFVETIKTITGGTGGDSTTKEALAEMRKALDDIKEDRWREHFDGQQKQILELTSVLNKALEAIADIKKERVGRTEMDIIHEIATEGLNLAKSELPGLRKDIKEAVTAVSLPPGKTTEQREERKKKIRGAIETDRDIEEIGRRLFFAES